MDQTTLTIYRKRLIPNECIPLKDDIILSCTEDCIVTKWKALKPKKDLHHGYSCYLLKSGIKISKFLYEDGSFMCWYCDIVDYQYQTDENILLVTDLLADVIIDAKGSVKVVDLDELATALEENLCEKQKIATALTTVNQLLQIIYHDEFHELTKVFDQFL